MNFKHFMQTITANTYSTMTQLDLYPEWVTNEKYTAWRETANGEQIYRAAEKIAMTLYLNGKRAGIRDIFSYIRVNYWLSQSEDDYKVNNNYSRLCAFEIEARNPIMRGYFEHRKPPQKAKNFHEAVSLLKKQKLA